MTFFSQWFSKYALISAALLTLSSMLWLYWVSTEGLTYELTHSWYVAFTVFSCNVGGVIAATLALDKREQLMSHKIWIFSLISLHLIAVTLYPILYYILPA